MEFNLFKKSKKPVEINKESEKKQLFLMCGAPGSGKSTWLRANAIGPDCAVVSRDEIRFSYMQSKDDHYLLMKPKFSMSLLKLFRII